MISAQRQHRTLLTMLSPSSCASVRRSHGLTLFVMLVVLLTMVDSFNVLDSCVTQQFRESLSMVMLMDLFVTAFSSLS